MKFTVELGDQRNGTHKIKTLQVKIRGHYSNAKLLRAHNIGETMAPMPEIPGLKMSVDTSTGDVRTFDPLEDKPELLARINRVRDRALSIKSSGEELTFVPATDHKLDPDGIKTLVMEVKRKLKSKCCRITEGELPSDEKIEKMPGRELNFSTSARSPKYKDEVEAFERELERV